MTECLCGFDHKRQREAAEAARRFQESMTQFAEVVGRHMAEMAEALRPALVQMGKLAEALEPKGLPPYDKTCEKCLGSTFIGAESCDIHAPPPPKKLKDKKAKKAKK